MLIKIYSSRNDQYKPQSFDQDELKQPSLSLILQLLSALSAPGFTPRGLGLLIALWLLNACDAISVYGLSFLLSGITSTSQPDAPSWLFPNIPKMVLTDVQSTHLSTWTYVGTLLGGLMSFYMNNLSGSRLTLVSNTIICSLLYILAAYSPNMLTLLFSQLCTGFFLGVRIPITYALPAEVFPGHLNSFVISSLSLTWSCAAIYASLMGYLCIGQTFHQSWRIYLLTLAIPNVLAAIFTCCFVQESIHFSLFHKFRVTPVFAIIRMHYGKTISQRLLAKLCCCCPRRSPSYRFWVSPSQQQQQQVSSLESQPSHLSGINVGLTGSVNSQHGDHISSTPSQFQLTPSNSGGVGSSGFPQTSSKNVLLNNRDFSHGFLTYHGDDDDDDVDVDFDDNYFSRKMSALTNTVPGASRFGNAVTADHDDDISTLGGMTVNATTPAQSMNWNIDLDNSHNVEELLDWLQVHWKQDADQRALLQQQQAYETALLVHNSPAQQTASLLTPIETAASSADVAYTIPNSQSFPQQQPQQHHHYNHHHQQQQQQPQQPQYLMYRDETSSISSSSQHYRFADSPLVDSVPQFSSTLEANTKSHHFLSSRQISTTASPHATPSGPNNHTLHVNTSTTILPSAQSPQTPRRKLLSRDDSDSGNTHTSTTSIDQSSHNYQSNFHQNQQQQNQQQQQQQQEHQQLVPHMSSLQPYFPNNNNNTNHHTTDLLGGNEIIAANERVMAFEQAVDQFHDGHNALHRSRSYDQDEPLPTTNLKQQSSETSLAIPNFDPTDSPNTAPPSELLLPISYSLLGSITIIWFIVTFGSSGFSTYLPAFWKSVLADENISKLLPTDETQQSYLVSLLFSSLQLPANVLAMLLLQYFVSSQTLLVGATFIASSAAIGITVCRSSALLALTWLCVYQMSMAACWLCINYAGTVYFPPNRRTLAFSIQTSVGKFGGIVAQMFFGLFVYNGATTLLIVVISLHIMALLSAILFYVYLHLHPENMKYAHME